MLVMVLDELCVVMVVTACILQILKVSMPVCAGLRDGVPFVVGAQLCFTLLQECSSGRTS